MSAPQPGLRNVALDDQPGPRVGYVACGRRDDLLVADVRMGAMLLVDPYSQTV